jgi:hypothetical protein
MGKPIFYVENQIKLEIIRLTNKLGFKSKFFHPDPLEYSTNEDDRWYLYMCEILKWIRTNYSADQDIYSIISEDNIKKYYISSFPLKFSSEHIRTYSSYEAALEDMLHIQLLILSI